MDDELIQKYLYDIAQSADKIVAYTQALSRDEYFLDSKTKDAVERKFEIIGEAVN